MKKYIDFNTEKRMNAANFEKDFFKLMINSVYRKTIHYKPTFINHKIFCKDYAAIHEIKPVLILNKLLKLLDIK